MKRGEIWIASLDSVVGPEQQGRRPVLIVSPDTFNRVTKVPVVVPITGGGRLARTTGYSVSLVGTGTRPTGIVRCDQPRVLDLNERDGIRVESAPEAIMREVLARVATIFE